LSHKQHNLQHKCMDIWCKTDGIKIRF